MFMASVMVISLMAATKSGFAALAASSAALFIDKMASSTFFPCPIFRSFSSTFLAFSGIGIFISTSLKYPSGFDNWATPFSTPLFKASFKPFPTSSSVKAVDDGVKLVGMFFFILFKNCAFIMVNEQVKMVTNSIFFMIIFLEFIK